MSTYDTLALNALLDKDQKRVEALLAHAKGCYACPDCGNEGPHDTQSDGFGSREFSCASCGMIHLVPPLPGPTKGRGR